MTKPTKKLIVVGHGRGGTSFANTWLNHNGIMTQHECMGRDGIVDSGLSVATYPIRAGDQAGAVRDDFEFKSKLCVVRDPWKTIATFFAVEGEGVIKYHAKHLDLSLANGDELSQIAVSVADWTRAGLEYTKWQFIQAEKWNAQAGPWLQSQGFDPREWMDVPPNTINHRPGKRLTRTNIVARITPRIAWKVKTLAEDLGYE